ncbi:MAG: O-antigen ligase family protein [Candidatus Omnitrophica bacterium]|nr:O-antigen ligase family protein [Candidatus Omnitrophota bacterium]
MKDISIKQGNFTDNLSLFMFCVFLAFAPFSKAVVEVCFASLLSLWLINNLTAKRKLKDWLPETGLNLPLFAFFLFCVFSIFISISHWESLKGGYGKWFEPFMYYFFTVIIIKTRKIFKLALWVITISFIFVLANAAWQFRTGTGFLSREVLENGEFICGQFRSLNEFGVFLILTGPIVTLFLLRSKINKAILLLFSVITAAILYLSFSAESWFAILLSIPACFLIFSKTSGASKILKISLAVFFVFLSFLFVPHESRSRILKLYDQQLETPGGRPALWRLSLEEIKRDPVFGKGISTTSQSVMRKHYTSKILIHNMHPHNYYLLILLETGIVGFSIFFWLVFRLFKIVKALPRDEMGFGFMLSAISFFLVNFVDTMREKRIQIIFWVIVGLMVAYSRLSLKPEAAKTK